MSSRTEYCEECNTKLNRVYTVPAIKVDFVPHFNDSTNTYISSKAESQKIIDDLNRKNPEADYVAVNPGESLKGLKPQPKKKFNLSESDKRDIYNNAWRDD